MEGRIEEKIQQKIQQLREILKRYEELNQRINHKYRYREQAIWEQIEILEELLTNQDTIVQQWKECLKEDESKY